MTYTYKQIEEQHIPDVQELLWRVFRKRYPRQYLHHKYAADYLGVGKVGTIAFEGQLPVAMYGAIPQRFRSGKDQILVAHTCDSFTLPQHQRKGLHYDLARAAYDIMRKKGMKGVYAFHSENTYHSCKKLGWEENKSMKRFHLLTGIPPLAGVLAKLHFQKLIQSRVRQVLAPFGRSPMLNPLRNQYSMYHEYDEEFFRYKNTMVPHFTIELEGCSFYGKVDSIMRIGFFDFPDTTSGQKALKQLRSVGRKIGVSEILFQTDPDSPQFRFLTTQAEALPSWKIGYLSFDDENDFKAGGFNFADLDTF